MHGNNAVMSFGAFFAASHVSAFSSVQIQNNLSINNSRSGNIFYTHSILSSIIIIIMNPSKMGNCGQWLQCTKRRRTYDHNIA